MKEIIEKLQEIIDDLKPEIAKLEKRGVENLNYEETEDYGSFLGQVELAEQLLEMIENINLKK